MMPTADMQLALHALLRALAASFAETPYTRPLIDWRGALQDRFALPWFLGRDLEAVLRHVNRHGFSFRSAWFQPHLQFRFPIITQFQTNNVEWSLRQALEPWPVMGDHTGAGRVVDSSTERLELLARGLGPSTDLVASVNGIRIPLRRQRGGVSVAGIRYRLVANSWGLQPHIKSQSPLRFQIIDRRRRRILHQFDYRDWPGMRSPEVSPPADFEEASRRLQQRVGRSVLSQERAAWRDVTPAKIAPFTLDLRRVT
jgi:uncharacterized protein (DUF2126 family)